MKTTDIILAATATFSALMAGLFYAYSCSVNLGLGKLSDIEYVKAMQSINREIQNPVFFACFFGILILLPLSTWLNFSQPLSVRFALLSASTIIYFTGVFGVTIFGNVPLNNALESFNALDASAEAIKRQRELFEVRWNFLNNIRTISSVITVVLVIAACIYRNKPGFS